MNNDTKYTIGGLVIVIAIIACFVIINNTSSPVSPANYPENPTSTSSNPVISSNYDTFAKCTASKGLTMYGAAWCSHCQAQKKLFDGSFQYASYVECPDNIKLCTDKGVNGYPTWIDVAGNKYEGEQSLENLAKISGCELVVDKATN